MEKKHGQKKVNTKVVISELHRAFKIFNEEIFNGSLPEPAILVAPRGNKKLTLGWCTVGKVWKNEVTEEERYEINICAEALNRGIYPVMATLLHEMVHLHNLVFEIKDTSRGGTYHNMKFKKVAEEHGLIIEHGEKIGWSLTKLQGTTMDLIDKASFDEAVFSFARREMDSEKDKPRKKKKGSVRKYVCPKCGCIIRASKQVNVICGDCLEAEGKLYKFIEEVQEDEDEEDVETGADEGTDAEDFDDESGAEEPTEEPEEDAEELVEYICNECGAVSMIPAEGEAVCPECGCIEMPEDEEADAEASDVPAIIEEPTKLNDGAGNMLDVLQGKIEVPKKSIKWTVDRIAEELMTIAKEFESQGIKNVFPDGIPVEISENMVSQWASYKEGKKFVFSKMYLDSMNDDEIIDTIKHQYIHHYQFRVEGKKVNHGKDFKALCVKLGVDTTTPTRNHRAVK